MEVEALSESHLDQAATLMVSAQRSGSLGPPARMDAVDDAARLIAAGLKDAWGLVAIDRGEVIGFLVVPLPDSRGCQRHLITDLQHAAQPGRAREVYRGLYQVGAAELVGCGRFDHRIRVLVNPPEPATALFELGFGVDQIKGILPTVRPRSAVEGYRVEPADAGDVEEMLSLWIELSTFHSRPPMFGPAFVAVSDVRAELAATITDDERVLLVARESGRPVGMIEAHPDGSLQETATIGINVVTEMLRSRGAGTAMLNAVLHWANDHGFGYCAVDWTSANPVSDPFWRARGFVPHRYELTRRIDPQVAWANENLNYHPWRRGDS